jgi:hypothetical protein
MWKILLGFALFAGVALYILTKAGGDVDMGGEKHEVVPANAASPAASAASH